MKELPKALRRLQLPEQLHLHRRSSLGTADLANPRHCHHAARFAFFGAIGK